MNTQHTPEPWELRKIAGTNLFGARSMASDWFLFENALEKDAIRILACVNACAGMEDPAKEIAELRAEIARLKNPPSAPTCDELDYDSRS